MLIKIANLATRILRGSRKTARLLKNLNKIIFACDIGLGYYIPSSCQIPHSRLDCVFHQNTKIGENCHIYPEVVFGASGRPAR